MPESTIGKLFSSGIVGTEVYQITGSGADAATAAGYGAFVESITGTQPKIVRTEDGRARVVLSEKQASLMRGWLEEKFQKSILPSREPPPSLEIEFSPVVKPIALKYIIVFSALFFMTGWLTRGFIR